MSNSRLSDLLRFYALVEQLTKRIGGMRTLADAGSTHHLPRQGVYFFFELSERRQESGTGPRLVRVGTHGLSSGSKSTLRQRLEQHRGKTKGGGNHRGSIFRLLVGQSLLASGDVAPCKSWGVKSTAKNAAEVLGIEKDVLAASEQCLELAVSKHICAMPFVWLGIEDDAGPKSMRGMVERNAIALLSNYNRPAIDAPSSKWLGHASDRALVRRSGLWNQRHVDEQYAPQFLDLFEECMVEAGNA